MRSRALTAIALALVAVIQLPNSASAANGGRGTVGGTVTVLSRATDSTGVTQPGLPDPRRSDRVTGSCPAGVAPANTAAEPTSLTFASTTVLGGFEYVDAGNTVHAYMGPLTVGATANTDGIQACEDVNGTYQVAPANAAPGTGRGAISITPVTGSVTTTDGGTMSFSCNMRGSYKRASSLLEIRVQTVAGQCTVKGLNDNAPVAVPGGINVWADVQVTPTQPAGAPALGRVTGGTVSGEYGVSDGVCRPWAPLDIGDTACP
jgi:hypothetical protein